MVTVAQLCDQPARTVAVTYGADTVNVTYWPGKLTGELLGTDLDLALAAIIEKWDVVDDDGKPSAT